MKKLFWFAPALILMNAAIAEAKSVTCTASGSLFGIVKIEARDGLYDAAVDTRITVKDKTGTETPLAIYHSKGDLNSEVQISDDLYRGPFGIQNAFLAKVGSKYELRVKRFCNGYYQEETCMDGDLLEVEIDSKLNCSVLE